MAEAKSKYRLTLAGWSMLGVALAIFGASFVHRVNLLLLLFALILATVVVGARLGKREHRLVSARRLFPPLVPASSPVVVSIEVANEGPRTAFGLMVKDRLGGKAQTAPLSALGPGQSERIRLTYPPLPRGEHILGPLEVVTTYPFGFVSWRRSMPEQPSSNVVIVHPQIGTLTASGHQSLGLLGVGEGRATTGLREGIDEFRGVREYRAGDPPKLIHWRSTARRGSLVVRELEPSAARNILLLVHLAARAEPAAKVVDDLLSFAATLVAEIARDPTLKLTMIIAGKEPVLVRGSAGKGTLAQYLRPLARARTTTGTDALAEACSALMAADVRDRKLWVVSLAGLTSGEEGVLRAGGFRRVSALRVLNAEAGDLAGLWIPPAVVPPTAEAKMDEVAGV